MLIRIIKEVAVIGKEVVVIEAAEDVAINSNRHLVDINSLKPLLMVEVAMVLNHRDNNRKVEEVIKEITIKKATEEEAEVMEALEVTVVMAATEEAEVTIEVEVTEVRAVTTEIEVAIKVNGLKTRMRE